MDDWGNYPTNDIEHYYSRSDWDVPNRFSLGYSYVLPGIGTNGLVSRVTNGFTLAGTAILQQGQRFTVYTNQSFSPATVDAQGNVTSLNPGGGDFNGDGNNYDFPNIVRPSIQRSRTAYLTGVFPASTATNGSGASACGGAFGSAGQPCGNFALPALGQEGNELPNTFQNPGFAQWDLDVKKVTAIREGISLELRLDVFNLFNRVNLYGVDGNANSGTFGKSNQQYTPRNMDVGVRVNF